MPTPAATSWLERPLPKNHGLRPRPELGQSPEHHGLREGGRCGRGEDEEGLAAHAGCDGWGAMDVCAYLGTRMVDLPIVSK